MYRRPVAVIAAGPDINDYWNHDEGGRHLGNTQHERNDRQHTRRGYAGEHQRQPDKDGLNEGDADDTQRDGADGSCGKFEASASPLWGPATRRKIARLAREPESPYAIMMLATINEARNSNRPLPMLATMASAFWANSPIFGCMLCTNPGGRNELSTRVRGSACRLPANLNSLSRRQVFPACFSALRR